MINSDTFANKDQVKATLCYTPQSVTQLKKSERKPDKEVPVPRVQIKAMTELRSSQTVFNLRFLSTLCSLNKRAKFSQNLNVTTSCWSNLGQS